jgi:aminoglycoside phosphotransferase (APT) family kinase protein
LEDNVVKNKEFNERIVKYLERQIPAAQELSAHVVRMMGGRSWDLFGVRAEWQEGGQPKKDAWVFKVSPKGGILEPHDPSVEFRLLEVYERNGLPVPRPVWLEMESEPLGRPFYAMEWVEGGDIPSLADPRFEDPAEKDRWGKAFAGMLARIHNLDWRKENLTEFIPPLDAPGNDPVEREIAWMEQKAAGMELPPTPALRGIFQWLRVNRPIISDDEARLVYGDYRFDNFFWKDGELVSLLDFEMGLIGHPMEDVAFARMLSGWAGIHGDHARHYEELSGVKIDEQLVAYFLTLKMTQITVIVSLAGIQGAMQGRSRDSRGISLANGAHVGSVGMLGQFVTGGAR